MTKFHAAERDPSASVRLLHIA